MRISLLIAAGIAALSAVSGAIAYQHGGIDDHLAMIAKHLHLTPSQENQLKTEHETASKKSAAIDANSKLDKAAKDKAKTQIHQEMMTKAHKILTPAQIQQLSSLQFGGIQKQMMAMMEKLDLSKTQKTAIHALVANTTSKMKALHNDKSLSDEQKQEKAMQLHNETIAKVHALLTPKQIEKAKAMHKIGKEEILHRN